MKREGFTLVEIMIVVAIIAVLASIAIPNFLRSRINTNEAAAQAALNTIAAAEITCQSGTNTFASLAGLGAPAAGPAYIDNVLAAGTKTGYTFTSTDIAAATFHVSAVPVTANVTGIRSFCVTEDGVVRVQTGGGAIASRAACLLLNAAGQ